MAYFDNAATTYPKPESVYAFMDEFYRNCGANVGRGAYKLAQTASKLVAETRELIKELLHCPAKQVIFTPTATIALNIVIKGLVELGVKNVYISPFEHNAVTRVLHHYEKSGKVLVSELAVTSSLEFDFEKIVDFAPQICYIPRKKGPEMEQLYEIFTDRLARTDTKFVRYLHGNINWNSRLIVITGARGVGKTTMLLQHKNLY